MDNSLLNKFYPFSVFKRVEDHVWKSDCFRFNDIMALDSILKDRVIKKAVEIGAWTGTSTCLIAYHLKRNEGRLFTIDNFKASASDEMTNYIKENPNIKHILIENLNRFDALNMTTILDGDSDSFVDMFEDESLDFIFLDGDHRYSQFSEDLDNWVPKVKEGGIITGHDYDGNGWNEKYIENDYVEGKHHGVSKGLHRFDGHLYRFQESSVWYTVKQTGDGLAKSLSLPETNEMGIHG